MPKKSKASAKQKRFDYIILISIIFSFYGLLQTFLADHKDSYAVVFAWLAFALVWGIVAVLRYFNLCDKC